MNHLPPEFFRKKKHMICVFLPSGEKKSSDFVPIQHSPETEIHEIIQVKSTKFFHENQFKARSRARTTSPSLRLLEHSSKSENPHAQHQKSSRVFAGRYDGCRCITTNRGTTRKFTAFNYPKTERLASIEFSAMPISEPISPPLPSFFKLEFLVFHLALQHSGIHRCFNYFAISLVSREKNPRVLWVEWRMVFF